MYPAKLSAIVEGERKTFHDTNRLKRPTGNIEAILWTKERINIDIYYRKKTNEAIIIVTQSD